MDQENKGSSNKDEIMVGAEMDNSKTKVSGKFASPDTSKVVVSVAGIIGIVKIVKLFFTK